MFHLYCHLLLCLLIGCKRVGKELSEKVIIESTEESTELISKRAAKSSLKELSEKSIKVWIMKISFPSLKKISLQFTPLSLNLIEVIRKKL